jgi:hypothetical protein
MSEIRFPKLRKILSDGRSGVGRAALDAAIGTGLPHGGWVSKGILKQEGLARSRYRLDELPAIDPRAAIAANVRASDGTLIIAFGSLRALPQEALRMTLRHKKQLLGIDLEQYSVFEAASLASSWLQSHHIRTLFVTGNDDTEQPSIYGHALHILHNTIELVFARPLVAARRVIATDSDYRAHKAEWPRTVAEAVERVMANLSLKEKNAIARTASAELDQLNATLGHHICEEFGLLTGNDALMEACQLTSGRAALFPDEASAIILRALWRKLGETYRLRVVK